MRESRLSGGQFGVDTTTLVTGFAALVVNGFMFSLTDNLPIILSRSRTDIFQQCPDVLVE